jgi:hypothetical protein
MNLTDSTTLGPVALSWLLITTSQVYTKIARLENGDGGNVSESLPKLFVRLDGPHSGFLICHASPVNTTFPADRYAVSCAASIRSIMTISSLILVGGGGGSQGPQSVRVCEGDLRQRLLATIHFTLSQATLWV